MSLLGKTALITGAGRGIGKGCALALARRGANVVINDRPGSPDLEETAAEIRDAGAETLTLEADVFSRAGCASLIGRTLEQVDGIDILVSNPAYSVRGAFLDYDPEVFERVIGATLVAGFHLSQLAARHMAARGKGGKMVFISSVHASMPLRQAIAYNTAKAGLNHMALSIARELVPYKINVNVIEPGWIDTPGEHESFGAEALAEGGQSLPWKRLGTPADIGSAAAFLSSADADYITGTIMRVDGGYMHKDA